jgi:apolipoprotein N-acyltransferase
MWAIGAAVLAGLAHAQSIAFIGDGQPRWWLQMLSVAVLCALLMRAKSAKRAALLSWGFATSWFAGTFWWLFISMHTYGGLPAVLAVLAVLALAAFLALYHAASGSLFWLLVERKRQVAGGPWRFVAIFIIAIAFACSWLLAELARAAWFTGFPWGASGYAHVDAPWIAAYAPWLGVYGVGAVAAFVACAAVLVAQHVRSNPKSIAPAAVVTLIVLAVPMLGEHRYTRDAGEANVVLLQGNIPQNEKFVQGAGIERALTWYGLQIHQHAKTSTLVIAPETALPLTSWQFERMAPGYLPALERSLKASGGALLTGIPLGDDYDTITNGVRGYGADNRPPNKPYEYSKHHLVPFGEFIPTGFRWFTEMMNIPLGDFSRGRLDQPAFSWGGVKWGPHICYALRRASSTLATSLAQTRVPT